MQVECLSLGSALVRMSAALRCVGTYSTVTSSRLSNSRTNCCWTEKCLVRS